MQGVKMQTDPKEIKLPSDANLVDVGGLLPEIHKDGSAYVAGLDGTLYPRTVNTSSHAGFKQSEPQAETTPSPMPKPQAKKVPKSKSKDKD